MENNKKEIAEEAERTEKIDFPLPVVVEGKYDKMKLTQVINAEIITTDGFGIFKKKEKLALIKKLSENGIVLLCDSDGAGGVIRRHIMSAVAPEKIYNLYIPKIDGKERRKKAPSREGTLGVEGMDCDMLRAMFSELLKKLDAPCGNVEPYPREKITKADMFADSLTGTHDSARRRDMLCAMYGLPCGMSAAALLGALNILTDRGGYKESVKKLDGESAAQKSPGR